MQIVRIKLNKEKSLFFISTWWYSQFSPNLRKPRNCLRTVTFILNVRDAEEEEEEEEEEDDEGDFLFKLRLVRPW